MGNLQSINEKRLTKIQVQKLIKSEGKLHEEFTKFFQETYSTGCINQSQVYELANDRFLFVFDPNGLIIPGKGNIYSKEDFFRWVRWLQKVRDDSANGRNSSVSHWRYYSKHKAQLVDNIDELINELIKDLNIPQEQLDFSYKSLDILSSKAEDYGLEQVQAEFYDNLVAYVGEVIRPRVKGNWVVTEDNSNCGYPAISAKNGKLIMPINVVWQELDGLEPMNLRKQAANEVRRFSLKT